MHFDWERTCIMAMAVKRQRRGLSAAEAIDEIYTALGGFSSWLHISRAVGAAYREAAEVT